MKKHLLFILAAIIFVNSCAVQPQNFDSQKWKAGDKSVRGSMVEDIKNNKILEGKDKLQVEALLGKPNEVQNNWSGYEVATTSRCYFWRCLMEINFDSHTKKMRGDISVSD